MKKLISNTLGALLGITLMAGAIADEYVIDTQGMHAFVQFRVQHLGMSWLYGRFNTFSGGFTYDESSPGTNSAAVEIDITSLDTNNADRDKHLRSADFLDADKFPTAVFESTSYAQTGDNTGELTGKLTLHGVTNEVVIDVEHIGGGDDPWGGFRHGFEGRASIKPGDYGIDTVGQLGPMTETVELMLTVEGIRQ